MKEAGGRVEDEDPDEKPAEAEPLANWLTGQLRASRAPPAADADEPVVPASAESIADAAPEPDEAAEPVVPAAEEPLSAAADEAPPLDEESAFDEQSRAEPAEQP